MEDNTDVEITQSQPFIVLVEGNVGSGKSTFLDIMKSWPGVKVLQEPVGLWRNVGGQNLFNDMVSQPQRWTTTFQLFSTMTRYMVQMVHVYINSCEETKNHSNKS